MEKQKTREAVAALSYFWRKHNFNITLKAHIIERHACDFNDEWGTGDKEESFIEKGHQLGAKDNSRYARLTNFVKKSDSLLNARLQSSHPLVQQQKAKVLSSTKQKRESTHVTEKEKKKEGKKIKREFYVSNNKEEK